MTKVIQNNTKVTESDTYPWKIFIIDVIYFLSKSSKVFQWFSVSTFLSFMTKQNPEN